MGSIESDEPFDIMLSPQFYTYKHEALPVRFRYQAARLAPSILEGLLPEEGSFEYFVFRELDGWAFIAYDNDAIGDFLREKDIAVEKVSKLYFAQQVEERFVEPVALGEREALVSVQHTATVLPRALLPDTVQFQPFSDAFRPSEGKTFGAGSRSFIATKEAVTIAIVLLLFAGMFLTEGVRYRMAIDAMRQKVDILLKDHPSLQSGYTRANIAKKYQKIDKEERHKREILKKLSRLLLPGVELESLKMEKKHYAAVFKCPDEKSVVRVQALAKERQFKSSRLGSGNLVKIEGAL
jgi:hypothetical protein